MAWPWSGPLPPDVARWSSCAVPHVACWCRRACFSTSSGAPCNIRCTCSTTSSTTSCSSSSSAPSWCFCSSTSSTTTNSSTTSVCSTATGSSSSSPASSTSSCSSCSTPSRSLRHHQHPQRHHFQLFGVYVFHLQPPLTRSPGFIVQLIHHDLRRAPRFHGHRARRSSRPQRQVRPAHPSAALRRRVAARRVPRVPEEDPGFALSRRAAPAQQPGALLRGAAACESQQPFRPRPS
mmetsp:Transcript_14917/g.47870  ORF Transcript_14917/g.47870 Transcript_14917/m.47870 type:complete len:235 (-) Transcript_14917:452-1156(-)